MHAITQTFDNIANGFHSALSAVGRFWFAVFAAIYNTIGVMAQVVAIVATVLLVVGVGYLIYTFVLQDHIAAFIAWLPALPF